MFFTWKFGNKLGFPYLDLIMDDLDAELDLKERCIWDIRRNIARLMAMDKLSRFFLLIGGRQSKEFFTDLPARIL